NTWQLIIINITKNTVINGKLSLDSLVKVNGIITGKYYTIYELNATQVNVLSYMFNNFSMSDYNS
ncbi:MAG: hypothetical protein RAK17_06300, partial [Caldisphaera sp.]|nr:hypothetical protein [Caldisphaera sp.]